MGPKGLPDIIVIVPPGGLFLALEVKSAKGTLRPDQKLFRDDLERNGGIYRVVRSLGDAQDVVLGLLTGRETWLEQHKSVWIQERSTR